MQVYTVKHDNIRLLLRLYVWIRSSMNKMVVLKEVNVKEGIEEVKDMVNDVESEMV